LAVDHGIRVRFNELPKRGPLTMFPAERRSRGPGWQSRTGRQAPGGQLGCQVAKREKVFLLT
jgi:hypothetical protein